MEDHQKEVEDLGQKQTENAKRLQEIKAKLGDEEKSGSGDMEDLRKALAALEKEAEEIRKQNDEIQSKEKASNYFRTSMLDKCFKLVKSFSQIGNNVQIKYMYMLEMVVCQVKF